MQLQAPNRQHHQRRQSGPKSTPRTSTKRHPRSPTIPRRRRKQPHLGRRGSEKIQPRRIDIARPEHARGPHIRMKCGISELKGGLERNRYVEKQRISQTFKIICDPGKMNKIFQDIVSETTRKTIYGMGEIYYGEIAQYVNIYIWKIEDRIPKSDAEIWTMFRRHTAEYYIAAKIMGAAINQGRFETTFFDRQDRKNKLRRPGLYTTLITARTCKRRHRRNIYRMGRGGNRRRLRPDTAQDKIPDECHPTALWGGNTTPEIIPGRWKRSQPRNDQSSKIRPPTHQHRNLHIRETRMRNDRCHSKKPHRGMQIKGQGRKKLTTASLRRRGMKTKSRTNTWPNRGDPL